MKQFASYNLFQPTFRIPQSDRKRIGLVLTNYLKLCAVFLKGKKNADCCVVELSNDGLARKAFIYDAFPSGYKERKEYTEHFSKEKIAGGIFKEKLFFVKDRSELILFMFLNAMWLPFLFMYSLFKKDKAPVANLFKEQLECLNLIKQLELNKVDQIFHFCIYEKDSNLNTLLLRLNGVRVNKIPSEVPLGIWNKIIIADKLCLCMGYQLDELKVFNNSVFVKETAMYGPENCLLNIDKYRNPVATKKNTIGFYSTGAWVRKMEDHNDQGGDWEKMEEEVKILLRDFCMQNPTFKLCVFLHPREKWDKYKEMTAKRYAEVFSGTEYEFSDSKTPSSLSFEDADVGIAFQSTVVYERLYYGFKTLIMPQKNDVFPVPQSNMKNICAYSKDQLFDLIKQSTKQTNREFFESNGISHYACYLSN